MKNHAKKLLTALTLTVLVFQHTACNKHEERLKIAEEAYLYALPLVIMDLTQKVETNVFERDGIIVGAPINQFSHRRTTATAEDRNVIRLNVDTLYSFGWLDLSGGPVIFSKPATDFYATVAVLDAYTNCYNVLGTGGLGGNGAAVYAIQGPGYEGDIPPGSIRVSMPTNMVWMMGRLEYNDNLPELHAAQDAFSLVPLSEYGNPDFVQPEGVFNPEYLFEPFQVIQEMDIETFFNTFNELALANPGTDADKPALERFAKLGIGPGLVFSLDSFPSETKEALLNVPLSSIKSLVNLSNGHNVKGWDFQENTLARYGTDYEFRAAVALFGLGANPVDMAVYLLAIVDTNLEVLDGQYNYQIHFEAGQLPPNDAFWSITAYDIDGFLIPNEHNKHAIRGRDNFVISRNGIVTFYLQYETPRDDLLANWLPIPLDIFQLTLRIYLPSQSVMDGTWEPPLIERSCCLASF